MRGKEHAMAISRRYFLKSGGIAMLGMAALPSFLQRAVAGTPTANKKKMVVLFQRGAMDGLNVVVPNRTTTACVRRSRFRSLRVTRRLALP
jgi:uncharacterized protein (DUF1501 family)